MAPDLFGFLLVVCLVMVTSALLPLCRSQKVWVFSLTCGLLFSPILTIGHGVDVAPLLLVLLAAPMFLFGWLSAASFIVTTALAFAVGALVIPRIPFTWEGVKPYFSRQFFSGTLNARLAKAWFLLSAVFVFGLCLVQGLLIAEINFTWVMTICTFPSGFIFYALLAVTGLLPDAHLGDVSGSIPYANGYANLLRYGLIFVGLPAIGYFQWFVFLPSLLRKIRRH